ncbi:DUF4326 domain-containing protein [Planomonospora parontospora]|uniref:DUF4326 domain-containing protein n=1 Tax=Planomonospora parontospora TaxID=58119 RepID=UPI0016716F8F|nr:DUF4326 domain-containing protein [Planomonospora parontospora]GGL55342.1 hypothetical protein GCM10014719_65790 [Planomonospora parontospora subsp. antibiotica]GII19805.1 hypothetical protein Ppa05_65310 [Planomonospora parontospora subsp. antibiotica]
MTTAPPPRRVHRRTGADLAPGTVWVGDGSRWATPFLPGQRIDRDSPLWPYIAAGVPGGTRGLRALTPADAAQTAALYLDWLIGQPALMLRLGQLAGRDLACACRRPRAGRPDHCHGRILLGMANDLPDDDAQPEDSAYRAEATEEGDQR